MRAIQILARFISVPELLKSINVYLGRLSSAGLHHIHYKKVNVKDKLEDIIDSVTEITPYTNPTDQVLLILDGNFLTAANSRMVVDSFTKGRHNNLSVIMITQNVFFPGKYSRTIALKHLSLHPNEKQRHLSGRMFGQTALRLR